MSTGRLSLAALVMTTALATAAPAMADTGSSVSGSAAQTQYVSPGSNSPGTSQTPGATSPSGSQSGPGSQVAPTSESAAPSSQVAPTQQSAPSAQVSSVSSQSPSGSLPFTGYAALLVLLIGGGLVLAGAAVRMVVRHSPQG